MSRGDLRSTRTPMEEVNGVEARSRRLPPLTVLPTLCTLGNLVAGFAAIFYATKPSTYVGWAGWSGLTMAGALVVLGMVLDAFDGSLARLTRSVSGLGSQLDSLADIITFGVAPAFMTLMLVAQYLAEPGVVVLGPEADTVLGKVIWGTAAVYVCCAALRLARFNLESGGSSVTDKRSFRGLPSPGAAGGVVSLVILHQHLVVARWIEGVPPGFEKTAAIGIPFVMLLCGVAMVSTIPYMHVANRFVHGGRSFGYVARLVVVLLLAIWWFQATMAVVFIAYLLSGPALMLWHRARGEREEDEE